MIKHLKFRLLVFINKEYKKIESIIPKGKYRADDYTDLCNEFILAFDKHDVVTMEKTNNILNKLERSVGVITDFDIVKRLMMIKGTLL